MRAFARVVYRTLLSVLPAPFRRAHGSEMEELYLEALDAAGRRGVLFWSYTACRGLVDVVEQSVRLRSAATNSGGRSFVMGRGIMEATLQETRLAVRALMKAPGFTLVAIVTLAFGIGANTSIFSLVNAVLLRAPAHIERPEELVAIFSDTKLSDNDAGQKSCDLIIGRRSFPAVHPLCQ